MSVYSEIQRTGNAPIQHVLPDGAPATGLLRAHILRKVQFPQTSLDRILRAFVPRTLPRRQFLLRQGEECVSVAYVVVGCLRHFTTGSDGRDHVMQFAVEDSWISDLQSFFTGDPTEYQIQALEDSELLLLDRTRFERMATDIPEFGQFFRMLFQRRIMADQERITGALKYSAEARYVQFLVQYPGIANRVSQSQIAAYLGIAPESLSRIRGNLAKRGSGRTRRNPFANIGQ